MSKRVKERISPIINWVVEALNADWLTAMVYQTISHRDGKIYIFFTAQAQTTL